MRCRVVSPFHDGTGQIGYIWLDCEFDPQPNVNDQLGFFPYGNQATVEAVAEAIEGFVHRGIDKVVYTTTVQVNLSSNSANAQSQILTQKWTWVREPNLGTPSHESDDDKASHNRWLASQNLPPVTSMARALTDSRNPSVGVCVAEKLSSGGWAIKA